MDNGSKDKFSVKKKSAEEDFAATKGGAGSSHQAKLPHQLNPFTMGGAATSQSSTNRNGGNHSGRFGGVQGSLEKSLTSKQLAQEAQSHMSKSMQAKHNSKHQKSGRTSFSNALKPPNSQMQGMDNLRQ